VNNLYRKTTRTWAWVARLGRLGLLLAVVFGIQIHIASTAFAGPRADRGIQCLDSEFECKWDSNVYYSRLNPGFDQWVQKGTLVSTRSTDGKPIAVLVYARDYPYQGQTYNHAQLWTDPGQPAYVFLIALDYDVEGQVLLRMNKNTFQFERWYDNLGWDSIIGFMYAHYASTVQTFLKFYANKEEPAPSNSSSRLFPETGKTVGGVFLTYWERNGG
jgi:hypothetical protein